jgi:ribosomal protein S18 acetylase RimI-like enzyme
MPISCRIVESSEAPLLSELMRAYYAFDGHGFDEAVVARTLTELLSNPAYGLAWFIEADGAVAGYMVICFGYSLELGGRDAFVDEIYLHERFRGQGLGREALSFMIAEAKRLGIKALHLEVDAGNLAAQRLYAALGFTPRGRFRLMSRAL